MEQNKLKQLGTVQNLKEELDYLRQFGRKHYAPTNHGENTVILKFFLCRKGVPFRYH
jgi:hypothetical protein